MQAASSQPLARTRWSQKSYTQRHLVPITTHKRVCVRANALQRGDNRTNLLDLVQWALTKGIKYSKIRPAELPGGRGLVATFPISSGEALVSVPRTTAITTHPSEPCPFPQLLPDSSWQQLPWYGRLAAKLLHEASLGPASQLGTFIELLPASVDLPALWSQEQLQQLQYPALQDKVAAEQAEWARCRTLLQPLLRAKGLSPDDVSWALACVSSRSFAGPYTSTPIRTKLTAAAVLQVAAAAVFLLAHTTAGAAALDVAGLAALAALTAKDLQQAQEVQLHAMCPVIDLFNHSSSSGSGCEFDIFEDAFKVVAAQGTAPGQELLISYGSMSNDSLLQLYGFVEAGNPNDSYTLVGLLARAQQVLGVGPGDVPSAAQQVLQAPVVITAAGCADDRVTGALQQVLQQAGSAGGMTAQQLLAAACRAELAAMGSSLKQDLQLQQALQQLPGLVQEQQELGQQLREKVAGAQQQLEQAQQELLLQQQEEAQQQQEEGNQAPAEAAARLQGQLEALGQQLQELVTQQQAVQQQLDGVSAEVQRCTRLQEGNAGLPGLALQLRIAKKQLLQAFCDKHQAAGVPMAAV